MAFGSGRPAPLKERIWRHIQKTDGCWLWTGSKTGDGYGQVRIAAGRTGMAHRVAYELLVGQIPEGLSIDHLCRNPSCVNPSHMEPVPIAININRCERRTRSHCECGHEYTPENTRYDPSASKTMDGLTIRVCRRCDADRQGRYQARRRAAQRLLKKVTP